MNPIGIRLAIVAALILGLGMAACDDEDIVGAYCSLHSYCYTDSYDDCMQTREFQEEQAISVGEVCHEAFLEFHKCIGELSCNDLDEYYTDTSHCGTEFNAWENRCLAVTY